MKLILVLSLVAFSYAAKLDRTYLPPSNADNAGGSPGAIMAPESNNESFGQGLPNISGKPTNSNSQLFGTNTATSNLTNRFSNTQSTEFGQPGLSNNGNKVDPNSIFNQSPNIIDDSNTKSSNFGQGFNKIDSNSPSSGTLLGQNKQSTQQSVGQVDSKPERAQASVDRNAEILKYINENNGDSYTYSYETSNGIAADESGVATNGVNAKGSYSYTGDDGAVYAVTYTADENGYQPQGDHLPTPHPIPEEILKSIELNAKAAASGTQEGAYRPEEYEYKGSSTKNDLQQPSLSTTRDSASYQNQSEDKAFIPSNVNNYLQQNTDKKIYQKSEFENKQDQQQKSFAGFQNNGNKSYKPQADMISSQFQRPIPGPQSIANPERKTSQISQEESEQNQKANGYIYDEPQKTAQGSNQYFPSNSLPELKNQNEQYQTFSPNSKVNNLSGQKTSQNIYQFNESQGSRQEVITSSGSQQGPVNGKQLGNGLNYNQPQKSTQDSKQSFKFVNQEIRPDQFSSNSKSNGFFGQNSDKTTNQFNQSERPGQGISSFGNHKAPSDQNQLGNGYNYNKPQKSNQVSNKLGSQANYPENISSGFENKGLSNEPARHSGIMFSKSQIPENKQNQAKQFIANIEYNAQLSGQEQNIQTSKSYISAFGNQMNQEGNQYAQAQGENGYNYRQSQTPEKDSNQFFGFENQQEQSKKYSPGFQNNDKESTQQQTNQLNNQYIRAQRPGQNLRIENNEINRKDQGQNSNGYNYYQPQKSTEFSHQSSASIEQPFSSNSENSNRIHSIERYNQNNRPLTIPQTPSQGFRQSSEFETNPGQSQNLNQSGKNDKLSASSYSNNSQFNQYQQPIQTPQLSSVIHETPYKKYISGELQQEQDENGYYYNRPQSGFDTSISRGTFGQLPAQSGFSTQPGSSYEATTFNKSQRPDQGSKYGQMGLASTNAPFNSLPSQNFAQDSTQNRQPQLIFGNTQVSKYRPGGNVPSDENAHSLNQFQSNSGIDSFKPQLNLPGDRQSSSTFGSSTLPQRPNQMTAQGYDYSRPGQTSQYGRPVSNGNENQVSPINKTGSARPEFGGPRQPPSFSPEEGYKY